MQPDDDFKAWHPLPFFAVAIAVGWMAYFFIKIILDFC